MRGMRRNSKRATIMKPSSKFLVWELRVRNWTFKNNRINGWGATTEYTTIGADLHEAIGRLESHIGTTFNLYDWTCNGAVVGIKGEDLIESRNPVARRLISLPGEEGAI